MIWLAVMLAIAAAAMYLKAAVESSHGRLVRLMHTLHQLQRRLIMALSDDVKQFETEVTGQLDEAIAEIQKIDALLNTAGDPDVPGAQAALARLREKFAALKAAVAVPEPGETPPTEG